MTADAVGLPPNPFHPLVWVVGEPTIGEGTWIGAFCVVDGSGGLVMGTGCDVAAGAQIYTHSTARRCVSGGREVVDRAPVSIGDRVFIGANSVVQMGVTIGDEAIVAAGAIVTRDVAPRTVVAGNPARVIGTVDLDDAAHPSIRRIDRSET